MKTLTANEIDELTYSEKYAEWLMVHSNKPICNGDMLLKLMEDGYMFDDFLASIDVIEA